MSEETRPTGHIPTITLFVALLNVILLLTLAGVVSSVRQEVGAIRKDALTLDDLARYVAPVKSPADFLDEKCTTCHADRRFLAGHGGPAEIQRVIQRMEALPDAHISVGDRDKIHGALLLMKCQRCHTEDIYNRMAALNQKEREAMALRMWEKSGTTLSHEELLEILKAYDQIQGF
jgi:hypothetical protein